MFWYQAALLIGAAVVAWISWRVPRAVFWVALGVLSGVASAYWHDAGLPHGAAFGAFTNLAICFLLYALAEKRWEMRLWNVFHLMIVVDILYLAGAIRSHYQFAVALELANWLGLVVIGSAGILDRSPHAGTLARRARDWAPDFVYRALHEKRSRPPFWEEP